ncbi:MAG TPA: hypothetical protein VL098_02745 [Flavipsychrobacter sp.]|nr:hypothetical protein [Flavipsychrobacter sp.]
MNIKKVTTLKKAFFTVAILALPALCYAAPPDPGGDPDEPVPVDGGISLLVAAGVGYGAKKLHDAKKNKEAKKMEA